MNIPEPPAAKSKKVCRLMGCELPDKWDNLGEVAKNHPVQEIRNQAKLWLKMGYKPTDYLCEKCFWK